MGRRLRGPVGRGLATSLVVDVLPRKAEAYAVAEGGLKEVADLCEGRSEESIESVGTNIRLVKADGGGFSVKKRERPPCEEERENYHIDRKSTLYRANSSKRPKGKGQ
ncbi:S-adenosyl-L-methionine-dependentmethyltransferases superfamily protein [Striga asiatica]|uniref:S-adenosyl-L-methionine-dependentmethyltransferases superfamily protein n=1 Tax=Striga asiatica TaxID=4170 RepID=A0A5A7PLJ9_STRAF|nr:S-adenosyl-L-methionine-dependentmethyltransferases superfamily protein [Striga asiatica]